jgi:hypothetical protein
MHNESHIAADTGEHLKHHDRPIVTFFRFVPEARVPMRADRAAAGTMPTRAFRYCEAMTSAARRYFGRLRERTLGSRLERRSFPALLTTSMRERPQT